MKITELGFQRSNFSLEKSILAFRMFFRPKLDVKSRHMWLPFAAICSKISLAWTISSTSNVFMPFPDRTTTISYSIKPRKSIVGNPNSRNLRLSFYTNFRVKFSNGINWRAITCEPTIVPLSNQTNPKYLSRS